MRRAQSVRSEGSGAPHLLRIGTRGSVDAHADEPAATARLPEPNDAIRVVRERVRKMHIHERREDQVRPAVTERQAHGIARAQRSRGRLQEIQ